MGQKAKNAGKKKSKPASNKEKARPGIISVKGHIGTKPSQEFMDEANEMIKLNYQGHIRSRFKRILRKTDVDKNSCITYGDTKHIKEQNTLT